MRARARARARVREQDKHEDKGKGEDEDQDERRARDRPDNAMPNCHPSGVAVGHCIVRGREEGMWEEDQQEEEGRQHVSASELRSLLDFPFLGVAHLAEPGIRPNRADCPIKSVLWLSQAELAHEPS